MINTILYLSQKQGRYNPRKKTYPVSTHYLTFKISKNHRMTPKNKSILLTRLYHIKNNFLAAEMNSRHAKIMYLGILVTKKILCWQRILIILVRIRYCPCTTSLLQYFYKTRLDYLKPVCKIR